MALYLVEHDKLGYAWIEAESEDEAQSIIDAQLRNLTDEWKVNTVRLADEKEQGFFAEWQEDGGKTLTLDNEPLEQEEAEQVAQSIAEEREFQAAMAEMFGDLVV
jgi:hypothetical protein